MVKIEEVLIKTEEPNDVVFECPFCPRTFTNTRSFSAHKKIHEKLSDFQENRENFQRSYHQCGKCLIKFATQKLLKEHIDRHYKKIVKRCSVVLEKIPVDDDKIRKSSDENRAAEAKKRKGKKCFKCLQCSQKFLRLCNLRRHTRIEHSNQKKYKCKKCGECFYELSSLKAHFLTRSCAIDPSDIKTELDLLNPNVKPVTIPSTPQSIVVYKCPDCPKFFLDLNLFDAHQKTHDSVDFSEKCFKIFTQLFPKLLNDESYKCSSCYKTFRDLNSLNEHLKTHTSKRKQKYDSLYRCNKCLKFFTRFYNLQRHQKYDSCVRRAGDEPEAVADSLIVPSAAEEKITDETTFGNDPMDVKTVLKTHKNLVLKRKFGSKLRKVYRCSNCKKHFKRFYNLQRHQRARTCDNKGVAAGDKLEQLIKKEEICDSGDDLDEFDTSYVLTNGSDDSERKNDDEQVRFLLFFYYLLSIYCNFFNDKYLF